MIRHFAVLAAMTVAAATMLVAASGGARAAKPSADLRAAETTINDLAGAIKANDAAAFGKLMVKDRDLVAFGTDASERWVGYDALMQSLHAQMKSFTTTGFAARDEVVHVLPSKDGAYFSEVVDWKIRSEGKDMVLKDMRLTGVLVKRGGHWLCAQFHFSMPVGGQAVAY